jgi:ATP-dependent DNA helicase RecG
MSPELHDDIQYLKGVGPSVSNKLNKLGIFKVEDLLYHFPRAYEDRRNLKLLSEAREGEKATFKFTVQDHSSFFYAGRTHPRIKVSDESGAALLYCFNRNYLTNILKVGVTFYLTGAYARKKRVPTFAQFDFDLDVGSSDLGIVPIYRLTSGLSQKKLRNLSMNVLSQFADGMKDDIPQVISEGYRLGSRGDMLKAIHFPRDMDSLRRAKEAVSYGEFFKFQIIVALARNRSSKIQKKRDAVEGKLKEDFLIRLNFPLTNAQKRVLDEIEKDLFDPRPMSRLIQGDVGSGKTVVALLAALTVLERGGQVAFMAPTEILAKQHFYTITEFFAGMPLTVQFISGSVRGEKRKEIVKGLIEDETDIIVGTHALFSDDIHYRNLSLVIIDEQHKFGVLQRGSLRSKGNHPDCLVMSATPIPRTLSMTLYGDLDVSVIDEMPAGRAGVETYIVKQAEIERVFSKVREEVEKGRQAYFIYPVIEESSNSDMKNAVDSFERLKNKVFTDLRIGLLHGRMSDAEKDEVMHLFKEKQFDVLVATTVVEVGVDVSNASVMVVEQAERFGLSSIHQLRGRIGRGRYRSYCFLVPDRSTGREAFNRLRILREIQDGFKIAEWDLRMRGPGEILGKRQSGVPSFIIDELDINTKLIYRAQKDARRFIAGEIGTGEEREKYLEDFMQTDGYRDAVLYFGG